MDALCIHSALEGRVGEAYGELLTDSILFGYAVLVVNFWITDGMEHQIHGGDAKHGPVRIKSREGWAGEMCPLLGGHGIFIVLANVF